MNEIWITVNGFEDYEISSCGRIRTKARKIRYVHAVTKKEHFRTSTERELKTYFSKQGYKFVQLYFEKKSVNITIHRLVASNFIDNKENLKDVNHIDGNKLNNTVENLEWCTSSYNHEHATKNELKARGSEIGMAILNEKCVIAIKKLLKDNYYTHGQIAYFFEVSRATISLIHEGKTWKHLTGEELNVKL